jgi:hypothetical protein
MGILQESKYPLHVSKFLLAMPFTQNALRYLPEEMFNDKILCATVILRNMNLHTEQYRLCCTVPFFFPKKSVCACSLLGMYMLKFVGKLKRQEI